MSAQAVINTMQKWRAATPVAEDIASTVHGNTPQSNYVKCTFLAQQELLAIGLQKCSLDVQYLDTTYDHLRQTDRPTARRF